MKITTNNVPRPLVLGYELTAKERKEFDYLDDEQLQYRSFFRYRGNVYDLSQFILIYHNGQGMEAFGHYDHTGELKGWDGIMTDSYFSGIVVKYVNDYEDVIVGTILS